MNNRKKQLVFGIGGIFSLGFSFNWEFSDFDIIRLGTHICEKDWALYFVFLGFRIRLEIYH